MSLSPEQIQNKLDRILLRVQKPGRYVGGELNQVVKPWDSVQTHVALIFPDIYDLGQPNLGLAILYEQINRRVDALAERAYTPWTDMEAELRANDIPFYSLESRHPLAQFDIIGITTPYESLYTNVLTVLDLAGLPLRASERNESHPLIVVGGHAAFNPEPMSEFIDAFVIGDGEGAMEDIIAAHQAWKASGGARDELWRALATIPGVYVPRLYQVLYHQDGTVKTVLRLEDYAHLPIIKRLEPLLPPPVTDFLVPSIDIVHNRVAIEIMRGCTRGCRFCQAGMITRPVRERPVEQIIEAMEKALDKTGYEEVALLSLSSSDYTHIEELVTRIAERFGDRKLTVSLPSLRIDNFSVALMDRLKELKPGGGFTMAPEAATERMRMIINKYISDDQIMTTVREVFAHGWTTIKLYFMIGHPDETPEDVQAIVDLCKRVLTQGRKAVGGRARVHAGVSTFIPKPHTPFQWVATDSPDIIREKQAILRSGLRSSGFKLTWVDPQVTQHEAWLARGDRRIGEVILRAWQLGARFDAWQDQFHYETWLRAFTECGLDPDFYSLRQRELDEVLPWSHIDDGVRTNFLKQDYQWSKVEKPRIDCRDQCFACGILPGFADMRRTLPEHAWFCPKPREKTRVAALPVAEAA